MIMYTYTKLVCNYVYLEIFRFILCFRYYCVSEIEYKELVVPEETAQKEMAERLKLVDVQDKS